MAPIKWEPYTRNCKAIEKHFGLTPPTLYSTNQLYSTGGAYLKNTHSIVVAQWVIDNATHSELIKILGHELAHAMQMTIKEDPNPKRNRSHTTVWYECMKQLGLEPFESVYDLSPQLAIKAPTARRKGEKWFKERVERSGRTWFK